MALSCSVAPKRTAHLPITKTPPHERRRKPLGQHNCAGCTMQEVVEGRKEQRRSSFCTSVRCSWHNQSEQRNTTNRHMNQRARTLEGCWGKRRKRCLCPFGNLRQSSRVAEGCLNWRGLKRVVLVTFRLCGSDFRPLGNALRLAQSIAVIRCQPLWKMRVNLTMSSAQIALPQLLRQTLSQVAKVWMQIGLSRDRLQ